MSKIDVHHHIYPPFFTQALENAGGDPSGWYIPQWTVELDHKFIAAAGVKTAILSVTAPGSSIEKDPAKAAALARAGNEYMAKVRDAEPARYGFFTALPDLFDTEACLREIAYGLDVLGADGVTLFTRYGGGHDYLGSAVFRPIWAELSRRKAVIFIHPTSLVDKTLVNQALPQPMFDYPHETGRTAIDLLTSGVLSAYPGCKIILSHAGGTLPYLIYRVAGMLPHMPVPLGMTSEELLEQARESFWFDTAISANPVTLRALFAFAKPGRVLFGSDFPNAPSEAITYFTESLEKFAEDELTAEQWAGVQFGNGLELFPRLKSLWESK